MKFAKVGNGAAYGTSLKGYLRVSYDDLVRIFGQPEYHDTGDKVQVEWCLRFEDGTIATIYDWKKPHHYTVNTEWNIGGRSGRAEELVRDALIAEVNTIA